MRKIRLVSILTTLALLGCNGTGIHTQDDNPNVVYLQGEACTMNMLPDMSDQELYSNFEFCLATHREFYQQ